MKLLALCLVLGQQIGAEQPSRKDQYGELGRRLLEQISNPAKPDNRSAVVHEWSRPKVDLARQYVRTLRDLATETVLEALARGQDLPGGARGSLQDLQDNLAETTWTNLPFVEKGTFKGREVVVVAFSVLQGAAAVPEPTPFIQFYIAESGMWRLAAEAPNDMEGRATRIVLLKGPVDNEVWVLAWGRRYGDNRAVASARVYAFDGASVRTVWQRDNLHGGEVMVKIDAIVVTYYLPGRLADPIVEEYGSTRFGIQRTR